MTIDSMDSRVCCMPIFKSLGSTLPRSFSLPLGMVPNALPDPFPELSSPTSHTNYLSMTVVSEVLECFYLVFLAVVQQEQLPKKAARFAAN